MGRAPCCDKANVKKGPWSPEEDSKLKDYIEKYGTGGNWISLPQKAGLKRCGKSCRLRWLNYLRPNIKHGDFSDDEDKVICSLFASIGSRWSIIASQLPGRTDNDIKNYWNTKLKKKLMGIVPSSERKAPHAHFASSFQIPSDLPSYRFSNNSTYYTSNRAFTRPEPLAIPSCFLNNQPTSFQPQDSLLASMQNPVKGNLFIMYGGEPSCSSSDGSCNQMSYEHGVNGGSVASAEQPAIGNFFYNGVEEEQKFMLANTGSGGGWSNEGLNVLWGKTSLDFGAEEIKQVITNNCSSNNNMFDENKTQRDKLMYY